MGLEEKLQALERIYALYAQYTSKLPVACRKYCAHCCTCNVTMTSLEAINIFQSLSENERSVLRGTLTPQLGNKRYLPEITLNRMASLCANGEDPPEEAIDPNWGRCPLLEHMACPIYGVRPFGCRCLLSTRDCGETGYAVIDDYTVTVNYVFSQFIEHLDQNGVTGNLTDVLLSIDTAEGANTRLANPTAPGCHLIDNQPIPMLLIPPEHQKKIIPTVNALHSIITAS
ncbi:MAG: hypothetical protein KGY61_05840 [Desulfobacterales bacterium]|nr:hypothetical protein [Desulfobacterales bacterium]